MVDHEHSVFCFILASKVSIFPAGEGHFSQVSLMRVKKHGEVFEFAVKELKILNTDVRASRIYLESEFGLRMSHCQFAVITYGVVAMGDCVRILMEKMDGSVEKLKTRGSNFFLYANYYSISIHIFQYNFIFLP